MAGLVIGSVNPSSKIPKLAPGVDLRSLPLSPTEGFVISRISGRSRVHEITIETGLPEELVVAAIDKLRQLGAVHYDGEPLFVPPPPPPSVKPAPEPAARPPVAFDARELDEVCELDATQKRRVLELFYALEERDYYELLGVPRSAEKKAIKRAYYDVAMHVHPDKFFRKDLGTFKAKMERVFAVLTLANDTLTDKAKRAEYDANVASHSPTPQIRIPGPPVSVPSVPPPKPSTPSPSPVAQARPQAPAAQGAPPAPISDSQPLAAATPAEIQARKELLARRLTGHGSPTVERAHAAKIEATAEAGRAKAAVEAPAQAVDALRRRYEDRVADARGAQSKKHVDAAEQALAAGDPVTASNALRLALSFAPEDKALAARVVEVETLAHEVLAAQYTKQATVDERNANWFDAARAWTRLARIRPRDPRANERAANAIVKSEGNLHDAADFARKAVDLEPLVVEHRLTLANVYLAAGLVRNARREVETAARTAPNDPQVLAALKRVPKAV